MRARVNKSFRPTHELVHEGSCYAAVRCGNWRPAAMLVSTGEVARSASDSLDNALLMGRWQQELFYLFGADVDHIPVGVKLTRIEV